MSDERYNGWANYETWLTKLWIDNDQGSCEYWEERAQEIWEDRDTDEEMEDQESEFRTTLSDELRKHFEEQASDLTGTAGLFSDLLTAALGSVDWREIADHYLADLDRSADTE